MLVIGHLHLAVYDFVYHYCLPPCLFFFVFVFAPVLLYAFDMHALFVLFMLELEASKYCTLRRYSDLPHPHPSLLPGRLVLRRNLTNSGSSQPSQRLV